MGHAEPDEEDELLTEFIAIRKKAALPVLECGFSNAAFACLFSP